MKRGLDSPAFTRAADGRKAARIVLTVLLCCAAVSFVDGVLCPGYAIKSAAKLLLFLLGPALCLGRTWLETLKTLFFGERRGLFAALVMGFAVFAVILFACFLLRNVLDFSAITASLTENAGVNESNFTVVALYISLVNSLLEELFFRGFAFLTLRTVMPARAAALFSAVVFALYHVSILQGWFSPVLYALAMLGLLIGALLFNWLDSRYNSLWPSYLVHMGANLAINLVGFLTFGIL